MAPDISPLPPKERPPTSQDGPAERRPAELQRLDTMTRASAAWFGMSVALVLMALLVVLILQNPKHVDIRYMGFTGSLPLGTALLIAAVTGAAVVTVIGVVRLTQLRVRARRARRVAVARHAGNGRSTASGSGRSAAPDRERKP